MTSPFTPAPDNLRLPTRPSSTPMEELSALRERFRVEESAVRAEINTPVLLVPQLDGRLHLRTRQDILGAGADAAQPSMHAFLVRKGKDALPSFGMGVTLGRVDGNDLVLPDQTVSRLHAYLVEDRKKRWRLFDAESRNGTFLNGRRLEPNVPRAPTSGEVLRDGDRIRVGSVELVYFSASSFLAHLRSLGPAAAASASPEIPLKRGLRSEPPAVDASELALAPR